MDLKTVLSKLEPQAGHSNEMKEVYLASIAMSLKRIADLMEYEQNDKRMTDNERYNQG